MAETVPQHPEAKPGEVFLTNCDGDEPDAFADILYQTKRAGQNAYDLHGHIIPHRFPVFVWEMEYDRRKREVKIDI